jgi:hypothetical protein
VTGRDGFGQHAQDRPVVGWYPSRYRGSDPFVAAGWRTGDGTGVRGVKFALTLQRRRGPG